MGKRDKRRRKEKSRARREERKREEAAREQRLRISDGLPTTVQQVMSLPEYHPVQRRNAS